MLVRRACSVLGTAAIALWLLDPVSAQDSTEAIPEELRIIEDLPGLADDRDGIDGAEGALGEDAGRAASEDIENGERTEEGIVILEGEGGSLFDENRSLLYTPDGPPAERLLPDDVDPEIDLDPRSAGEDDLDPRRTVEDSLDPRTTGEDRLDPSTTGPQTLDGPAGGNRLGDGVSGPQGGLDSGGGAAAGGSSGGGSLF